jgi:hypothetical protein
MNVYSTGIITLGGRKHLEFFTIFILNATQVSRDAVNISKQNGENNRKLGRCRALGANTMFIGCAVALNQFKVYKTDASDSTIVNQFLKRLSNIPEGADLNRLGKFAV